MKKITLTLFIICCALPMLHAQTFEFSVGANTGLFAYSGPGSTANTMAFQGPNNANSDVLNAYGNKYAVSYGAFLQPQLVFKSGFIVGLQASYNFLRSKDGITAIYPYQPNYLPNYYATEPPQPASGSDIMQTQVININPYIGYRITAGNVNIDLMPGISIGFDLSAREKGKAVFTGQATPTPIETNNKQPGQPVDAQLKMGIALTWHRWSLVTSYAYGLTDLEPMHEVLPEPIGQSSQEVDGYNAPFGKIRSSLFRLGIGYSLHSSKIK